MKPYTMKWLGRLTWRTMLSKSFSMQIMKTEQPDLTSKLHVLIVIPISIDINIYISHSSMRDGTIRVFA